MFISTAQQRGKKGGVGGVGTFAPPLVMRMGTTPQVECPFERGRKGSRAKSVRENSNDSGPWV